LGYLDYADVLAVAECQGTAVKEACARAISNDPRLNAARTQSVLEAQHDGREAVLRDRMGLDQLQQRGRRGSPIRRRGSPNETAEYDPDA